MTKPIRQILSLTLTFAITAQSSGAAFDSYFQPTPIRISTVSPRFQVEALALFPLENLRFIFKPFTSFGRQLYGPHSSIRYSQSKMDLKSNTSVIDIDEKKQAEVRGDMTFRALLWLDAALKNEIKSGQAPTIEQQILGNVFEFIRINTYWNFLRFQKFPDEYSDRMIASYRDANGRKWIILNPRALLLLEETMANNIDGDFIVTKLLIEEVIELMLEDPLQNSWSHETDIDEPWVEAYIFRFEGFLFRLWRRVNREKDFSRLRTSMEKVFLHQWLGEYFNLIETLDNNNIIDTPVEGLSEEKVLESYSLFIPLLTLSYDESYVKTLLGSIQAKWEWASRRLREWTDRQRSIAILSSQQTVPPDSVTGSLEAARYSQSPMKPNSPESGGEVSLADQVRQTAEQLYIGRTLAKGITTMDHCDSVAETYKVLTSMAGLRPSEDALATAYLLLAEEKDFAKIRTLRETDRDRLRAMSRRVNEAFTIPYDPPPGIYKIQPNALTYQMGLYGKTLESLDELLLLIAFKLVTLENPYTLEADQEILDKDLQLILAPLLSRLGLLTLSTRLRDRSMSAAYPDRHRHMERLIEDRLGMTHLEAILYENRIAQQIQTHLLTHQVNARVEGEPKTPASVDRKGVAKPAEYSNVSAMEDLIRFRVILDQSSDPGRIAALIGEMPFFTGRLTTKGVPEVKRLPGYNAFHITFVAQVGDRTLPHEFQIWLSREEYLRYEYGWPRAWWAYALKQATGVLPDFEPFEVIEDDLRGNYGRFRKAIEPYTYFSISYEGSGRDIRLIPSRIPNADGTRGNVIDAAVASKEFTPHTVGANTFRLTFNPLLPAPHQWIRTPRRLLTLDSLIENGMVVGATEGTVKKFKSTQIRQIEKTASTLQAIAEINAAYRNGLAPAVLAGNNKLVAYFNQLLGQPEKVNGGFASFYKAQVLAVLASKTAFKSADYLLSALGLESPDQVIRHQQVALLKRIQKATELYGAEQLLKNKILIFTSEVRRTLEIVAQEPEFKLPSANELVLAVGFGRMTVGAVQNALARVRSRSVVVPPPPIPFAPSTPRLISDVELKAVGELYELTVTANNDQPGITASILPILTEHGLSLREGSRSKMRESGAYVRYVLAAHHDLTIDVHGIELQIKNKLDQIPLLPPITYDHRFSVSLLLSDQFDALNQFVQSLKETDRTINLDYRIDTDGWIEAMMEFPEFTKNSPGEDPQIYLRELLAEIQTRLLVKGKPLITTFEMSNDRMSEATTFEILKRMHGVSSLEQIQYTLRRNIRRWVGAPAGIPKALDVDLATIAMKLSEELHAGETRLERGHPPYATHPFNSAIAYIREGGRDLMSIIVLLLHDTLENHPKEVFKSLYPGEKPSWEDSRLIALKRITVEIIQKDFPTVHHQVLKGIEELTYDRGVLAQHAQKMMERGDFKLSSRKLVENTDNIKSFFKVDRKEYPDFSPRSQIAKSLRYRLPLITQELGISDRVYRNISRAWLREFILKSNQLSDNDFLGLLYVQSDRGEVAPDVRTELIHTLHMFFTWWYQFKDILSLNLDQSKVDFFMDRMQLFYSSLEMPPKKALPITTEIIPPPTSNESAPVFLPLELLWHLSGAHSTPTSDLHSLLWFAGAFALIAVSHRIGPWLNRKIQRSSKSLISAA